MDIVRPTATAATTINPKRARTVDTSDCPDGTDRPRATTRAPPTRTPANARRSTGSGDGGSRDHARWGRAPRTPPTILRRLPQERRGPSPLVARRRQPAPRQETCHVWRAGTNEWTAQRTTERTTLRPTGENGAACERPDPRSPSGARHRRLRIGRPAGRGEGGDRQQECPSSCTRLQPDHTRDLNHRGSIPPAMEPPRARNHCDQRLGNRYDHLNTRASQHDTTSNNSHHRTALATPIATPVTRGTKAERGAYTDRTEPLQHDLQGRNLRLRHTGGLLLHRTAPRTARPARTPPSPCHCGP